jgi:hypothetical protein
MIMYATSLFLVAFAVVLLMAPAAYHRIVYAGEDSEDMHRVGSVLVTAATVPLALGLAGNLYVVVAKIMGSPTAGLIAGSLALVLLIGALACLPFSRSLYPKPGSQWVLANSDPTNQLYQCSGLPPARHSPC